MKASTQHGELLTPPMRQRDISSKPLRRGTPPRNIDRLRTCVRWQFGGCIGRGRECGRRKSLLGRIRREEDGLGYYFLTVEWKGVCGE